MRFHAIAGTCLLAFASNAAADALPPNHMLWGPEGPPVSFEKRAASTSTSATATSTKVADSACTNSPSTRQCWSNGYSAATDFDAKWPKTGVTRTYNLEITNGTCNPDGNGNRQCQLFNKQYPGPVITANWGDTISVTVKNSLQANGTGVHWHGIRMLNNNPTDGVGGITECPIAPGDSKTYTFQASQHGTTWYHSHLSAQYGDGAFGPIIINGPSSANYDYDLGTYTVNDFYYKPIWQMAAIAHANLQKAQGPPTADTILVNGTNKNAAGGGKYSQVSGLKPGKKYKLRLINTSVDNSIYVSLDNHSFTIITSDLVPIKPITANWVLLAIGQRYDVIFTANQTAGNYWFRAEAATGCASANSGHGRGVFSYDGVTAADPSSTAFTQPSGCTEMSPLVPWVANTVGSVDAFKSQVQNLQVDIDVEQTTTNGQNIVVWGVNLTGIDVNWDKPTLQYVKDGNTSYPSTLNLIEIPKEGIWSYWIIQEPSDSKAPIPHPIHLHGHDFYVLGQGSGVFDINSSPSSLTFTNPTRRDTALLPGGGWLALAFPTDNPGAWLMHCHIAFHVSDGLGVQFLEAKGSAPVVDATWEQTCANWKKYDANPIYPKTDSGL